MKFICNFYIYFFLGVIFIYSCTKDIKEVGDSVGLDTIPYYRQGSSAFDTKAALQLVEEDKKVASTAENEREAFAEEIKKRLEEQGAVTNIPDPWVPPQTRKISELPPDLRAFPKDDFGYPDWVGAVKQGIIKPRGAIRSGAVQDEPFEEDITFLINDRLMANVVFPHKTHNYWLSCKVCHPGIFIDKKGANKFAMKDIWNGQYCGRCHGKVSFQPKGFENCRRCHSAKKTGGSLAQ